ncbi:MAG: hypothetical protein V3U98_06050 [Acidobacteriota bacterium]
MFVDYETKDGMCSALCYQLWSSWMDLRTIRPLPIGSSPMFSFTLPGSQEKVQLRGKVVETRPQGNDGPSGKPAGMRVQFLSPDTGTIAKISYFLRARIRCR